MIHRGLKMKIRSTREKLTDELNFKLVCVNFTIRFVRCVCDIALPTKLNLRI